MEYVSASAIAIAHKQPANCSESLWLFGAESGNDYGMGRTREVIQTDSGPLYRCKDCDELKPRGEFSNYSYSETPRTQCRRCAIAYQASLERRFPGYRKQKNAEFAERMKAGVKLNKQPKPVLPSAPTRVRQAVHIALRAGKLTTHPCEVCGNPMVEAHHPSYADDMALCVTWLCIPCHRHLHTEFEATVRALSGETAQSIGWLYGNRRNPCVSPIRARAHPGGRLLVPAATRSRVPLPADP